MNPSRIFRVAGWYGIVTVLPFYLLEDRIAQEAPPAITHPEFYYGFLGVALAWQVLFLLIAREPERLRPAMLPAALEKAAFFLAVFALWATGRCAATTLSFAAIDAAFGVAFVWAWTKTPER